LSKLREIQSPNQYSLRLQISTFEESPPHPLWQSHSSSGGTREKIHYKFGSRSFSLIFGLSHPN
jgi:hypothetical protein